MNSEEPIFNTENPFVDKALNICMYAHKGQLDKSGKPYHDHPIRIAKTMVSDDEIIVALLHDVIEDTCDTKYPITLGVLKNKGIPNNCIEAIDILTRHPQMYYGAYIAKILNYNNPLALKVKKADLMDNINLTRFNIDTLSVKDVIRSEKYIQALLTLLK